jgi:aspartyl protease family protein
MSGDTAFSATMMALMLILPLSALLARRLPISATLKMAAAWAAIFAVALLVVAAAQRNGFRLDDIPAALGLSAQQVSGNRIILDRGPDGHFWAVVTINGHRVRMLIDSGATTTAISEETARAAGIEINDPFGTLIETANGTIVAKRAIARTLDLGPIHARDLAVSIAPGFGEGLIGMNFLSSLQSWRVEGDRMILEPHPTKASI